MIKKREVVTAVILLIVTCGIYGIIWFVGLTDDVKTVSEDPEMPSGGKAFLLTLVTCGIYGLYWAYKIGKAMQIAQQKNGLPDKDNSTLYLILEIFIPIVIYILVQSDLNAIADKKGVA